MEIELESVLTCPACGHAATAQMPTDACQFFWFCPRCNSRIRPLEGDCCVFCSYGTTRCPPKQAEASQSAHC
ncbi:GDCCVxC domain-containing (seleno)protein [Arthrobacter sulfonylureivorans]|uniref:GDCCVxC domain-containing (seleno)protein n=1 Tax=Arthrobacter sulfonylureivorans TaxID=2486855 RepID=UPI000FD94CED